MNGKELKLAAFVDNFLLFLSAPHTLLPTLLAALTKFTILSNLKINYSKFNTLNVLLTLEEVLCCKQHFPFPWQNYAITYLGIQLPANLSDLYSWNFLPLLSWIQQDLQQWDKLLILQSISPQNEYFTLSVVCV